MQELRSCCVEEGGPVEAPEVLESDLRLLSVQQVSDLLQISRSAVYDAVRTGKLRKVPLNGFGKTRFRPSDVAAFVEGGA
jgi:excisionase family DNA binding protein